MHQIAVLGVLPVAFPGDVMPVTLETCCKQHRVLMGHAQTKELRELQIHDIMPRCSWVHVSAACQPRLNANMLLWTNRTVGNTKQGTHIRGPGRHGDQEGVRAAGCQGVLLLALRLLRPHGPAQRGREADAPREAPVCSGSSSVQVACCNGWVECGGAGCLPSLHRQLQQMCLEYGMQPVILS